MLQAIKEYFKNSTEVIQCPHCGHLYKYSPISSYLMSFQHYSDGQVTGYTIPSVIRCGNYICNKYFNYEEIPRLDIRNYDDSQLKEALNLNQYNMWTETLESALLSEFCNVRENEIKVRTLLFRRYNDVFRKETESALSENEWCISLNNIEKLIELIKNEKSSRDRLFLAELYRQKGDFDSCLQTIEEIKTDNNNVHQLKKRIANEAKIKNDKPFKISHALFECIK